ncbi:MAG: methyltransferase domain-containing protein [Gemmataceae bacterium]
MNRYLGFASILVVALVAWAIAFYILTSFRTPDVPYVHTPPEVVEAMVDLAELQPHQVVYDLGCGDGRLVIAAVKRDPTLRGVGIDIDPQRIAEAKQAAEQAGVSERIRFVRNDLFREDFRPADAILMYLMTNVNERLIPQFERLKPGTRIVSHAFRIPGIRATKTLTVSTAQMEHTVHLYITPLERE